MGGWLFGRASLLATDQAVGQLVYGMNPLEAVCGFVAAWHVAPASLAVKATLALAR